VVVVVAFSRAGVVGDPPDDEPPQRAAGWREVFVMREAQARRRRHLHLEQLRTYGDPERDPRGRVISVAYLALGPGLPAPVAGTDARSARWVPVREALDSGGRLAFDHLAILCEALDRARSHLEYTTVAAAFCAEPFSISDLRHVYEAIWGVPLDPSNFRRKVTRAWQFVEPTGDRRLQLGRPAALYRRGGARQLFPPLLRSGDITEPGRHPKSANERSAATGPGRPEVESSSAAGPARADTASARG
jgi:hypothetical protein